MKCRQTVAGEREINRFAESVFRNMAAYTMASALD